MVEKIKVNIEEAKESKSMPKTMECQDKQMYNNLRVWGAKIEKLKSSIMEKGKDISVISHPYLRAGVRVKRSAMAAAVVMILYACIFQLSTLHDAVTQHTLMFRYSRNIVFRQPRDYKSNGYIMISTNGGLNQMRSGICDMVAIARHLNATLIVPELDKTSFWNDQSKFEDIFDVDHFIASLSDEVRILKELPEPHKPRFSMAPGSWSDLTFYDTLVLQRLIKHEVLHFTQTDTRLANNGIPLKIQQLRCRANYEALKFTPKIEEMGNKIVKLLRNKGPFVALHLRYEMDMLAFTGCTEGCNEKEIEDLTALRYAYPWWKQKEINSEKKRITGGCPVTPEETALALRALDINPDMQIYIAAGDIYGGEKRLTLLRLAFPHLVKKETLLSASELEHFLNHSNQMAALDYYVSLESDIFVPTHRGNMALLVEGHRRYLGYRTTIVLDRGVIVYLADRYRNGTMSWQEFSDAIKTGHAGQFGTMTPRLEIKGKPKQEHYFYSNPYECMPPFTLTDHRP